jgi:hypothetical protein
MKRYLNALSPGRILATFVYPNECDQQVATTTWLQTVGSKKIALPKRGLPAAGGYVLHSIRRVPTGHHGYQKLA